MAPTTFVGTATERWNDEGRPTGHVGPARGSGARVRAAGFVRRRPFVAVPFSLPDDRLLSREHFLVEVNPRYCDLLDLGSTNGTKVNGLRVDRVRLSDGDVVAAGDSAIGVALVEDGAEANCPPPRCPGCGADAPAGPVRRRARRPLALPGLRGPPAPVPHDPPRLPDREADRQRRDGRGLPRPPALDQPPGRHQDDGPHRRGQRQGQGLLPPRDDGPQRPAHARRRVPPQHRRLLRHLRDRRPVPARHGVRPRQERAGVGHRAWRSRCRSARRLGSAGCSSRRSTTRTRRATSTATSSRRTC